jgi:glycine betaine/proline transport system ATP-binding protein
MRDGRLIQVGTAEEIVMNPADDYVSDFVAGISRLKIVKAHTIMQPLESYIAVHGEIPGDAPSVIESASLSELIQLAIDNDTPIVVQDNGSRVGVINRTDILRTVIEGAETS